MLGAISYLNRELDTLVLYLLHMHQEMFTGHEMYTHCYVKISSESESSDDVSLQQSSILDEAESFKLLAKSLLHLILVSVSMFCRRACAPRMHRGSRECDSSSIVFS